MPHNKIDITVGTSIRWRHTAILLLVLSQPAAADWVRTRTWAGIDGVSSVMASTGDPRRVYAVPGNTAWLLFSEDGGISWHQTAAVPEPAKIGYAAVDPHDSSVFYVGTSGDAWGMYRSIDGGNSFTPLGERAFRDVFALGTLVMDPANPFVLYASRASCGTTCNGGGVLKSIDAGQTWTMTGRIGTNMLGLAIDPNTPNVAYGIGIDLTTQPHTGGLYRTTDGGLTWPPLFPGLVIIQFVAIDARSRLYVIAAVRLDTSILRSGDQGTTFERLATDPNLVPRSVAIDPRRPGHLYAAIAGPAPETGPPTNTPGVIASFDDGMTWQALGSLKGEFVNTVVVTADGVIIAAAKSGIYCYTPPGPRRRAVSAR